MFDDSEGDSGEKDGGATVVKEYGQTDMEVAEKAAPAVEIIQKGNASHTAVESVDVDDVEEYVSELARTLDTLAPSNFEGAHGMAPP